HRALTQPTSPTTLLLFSPLPRPPTSPLFPYTTLFRSVRVPDGEVARMEPAAAEGLGGRVALVEVALHRVVAPHDHLAERFAVARSEEHTSELQSRFDLVCRLLLEKKKTDHNCSTSTHS